MSGAWEITAVDVETVLTAHGIKKTDEEIGDILENLDHENIERRLLTYTSMNVQIASSLDDIEDELMNNEIIPKSEKKFTMDNVDENEYEDCEEG